MNLKIGYTTGDKFDVNKVFTEMENTTAVDLYGETSLTVPVIIISIDLYNVQYNYCYLSDFGRYYYINSVEIDGERVILHLVVDVWKTFATQIKNVTGRIIRSESIGINNITDNKLPLTLTAKTTVKKFSSTPFNTESNLRSFVLITAGGHAND